MSAGKERQGTINPSSPRRFYWEGVVPSLLAAAKKRRDLEIAADNERRTGQYIPDSKRTAAASEIRDVLERGKQETKESDYSPQLRARRFYDLSLQNEDGIDPNFRDLARGGPSPRSIRFQTGERTNNSEESMTKADKDWKAIREERERRRVEARKARSCGNGDPKR